MIRIEIEGATGADVAASLHSLLSGLNGSTGVSSGTVAVTGGGENSGASGSTPEKPATRGRGKSAAADKQNISTGEERADPATSATDQVLDAKDEAADTKAQEPEPYKFSHDSVRAVLGGYVQAYGMAAAQEDGAKLLGFAKVSEIPDDQKALAKAVLDLAKGIETNPHKRDPSGDGITKEKIAELNPIVLAAQKVA